MGGVPKLLSGDFLESFQCFGVLGSTERGRDPKSDPKSRIPKSSFRPRQMRSPTHAQALGDTIVFLLLGTVAVSS